MAKANGKVLRFASLIRVSDLKQAKEGESLRTQTTENERSVTSLGGKIIAWYGGQEHATPGYEKKEVERLLADAKAKKFDAVIVSNVFRWSRDNSSSKEGLKILKDCGVRFFIGMAEYDLYSAMHNFFLGMAAEMGEMFAAHQNHQSLTNRLHRAKRGIPAVGKRPFGRIYDKKTHKWSLDKKKKAMIEDVAKRYLAGESLVDLSIEYGINHTNLQKILSHRCGTEWVVHFQAPQYKVDEKVTFTVPRLLPEETIKRILNRKQSNRTFRQYEKTGNKYVLQGYVRCAHCGYRMTGSPGKGPLVYEHKRIKGDGAAKCPVRPRPRVRADDLERAVIEHILKVVGNPVAMEAAIKAKMPNLDKIKELEADLASQAEGLTTIDKKIKNIQKRVLENIENEELVDPAAAKDRIAELRAQRELKQSRYDQIKAAIDEVPTKGGISDSARRLMDRVIDTLKKRPPGKGKVRKTAKTKTKSGQDHKDDMWVSTTAWIVGHAGEIFDELTWEHRRDLIEYVFAGPAVDDKKPGVYLLMADRQPNYHRKVARFELIGNLPMPITKGSTKVVSDLASACTTPSLPARRCGRRSLQSAG